MGRSIPGEGTHKDPRVGSVWTGVCFPMCDVSSATPCQRAVRLSEGDRGRGYGWEVNTSQLVLVELWDK